MDTQSWRGDTVASGEDDEAQKKLVWILASWVKRQQGTAVDLVELVEALGLKNAFLEMTSADGRRQLAEAAWIQATLERGTSLDGTTFDNNEPL